MDLQEIYTLLFTDTLVSNLAFNTSTELAIHSMKTFGTYSPFLTILVASLAFLIAGVFNYIFGMLCFKILSPIKSEEPSGAGIRTEKVRRSKYIPLFLLLSATPFFGKFILMFAGFCRVRFALTIFIASIARFTYYSYTMFV